MPVNSIIFILEDQQERIQWFRSVLEGEGRGLVIARTVAQALVLFQGLRPELVFLDHDLDNDAFNYDDAQHSGTAFLNKVLCSEIEYPGLRKAEQIVIHSANPPGAGRMLAALKATGIAAEWIPYMTLTERLKVA